MEINSASDLSEALKQLAPNRTPIKIPVQYTAKTFPVWAVWIREKSWIEGARKPVFVFPDGIDYKQCSKYEMARYGWKDTDLIEIASSIPDKDGNIVWEPFYQFKTVK